MNVHNHGSEDGPGLACREYKVGEYLIGHCKLEELANNIHNTRLMPGPACQGCWDIARAIAAQGLDWQGYRQRLINPAWLEAKYTTDGKPEAGYSLDKTEATTDYYDHGGAQ